MKMKTIPELEALLLNELKALKEIALGNIKEQYYNSYAGVTSVLLTSLLEEALLNTTDWDNSRWLDDSLLTKLYKSDEKFAIWGVVIWGKTDTTEQWTDPFYFEAICNKDFDMLKQYTFLFEDVNHSPVSYTEFSQNRDCWDEGFFSTKDWDPAEREWKYIINKKVN